MRVKLCTPSMVLALLLCIQPDRTKSMTGAYLFRDGHEKAVYLFMAGKGYTPDAIAVACSADVPRPVQAISASNAA